MPLTPNERANDREGALRSMLDGRQAETYTALPCIVRSFNAAQCTLVAQPAINARRTLPDGTQEAMALPLLLDVPVCFPGGGGMTLTFPVAPGDECLVVFASRCIDGWWQLGGQQPALAPRMHSLSDGFAFVGVRSAPRALPAVSTSSVQLRNDAGTVALDINGATGIITAVCTELRCTGRIVSDVDVEAAGIELTTHRHTGVDPGGGTSGGPTP
jgi:hypothetical protein